MLTSFLAHTGRPVAPHDVWTAWSLDPVMLGAVALAGLAYARGRSSLRGEGRNRLFLAGLVVVASAVMSPLDAMARSLASAHMVQHMLLVVVAGPLLAGSRPLDLLLRAAPRQWRKRTGRWRRRLDLTPHRTAWLAHPILAWFALAGSLWLWHSSALYGLSLRSEPFHALEHAMFVGAAVWFWNAVLGSGRGPHRSPGAGILLLFTMAIQGVLLSAMLTFSGHPWYSAYLDTAPLWGLSPLEDQHLAGLIMWIPGGLVYTGAALAVLGKWLGSQQVTAPGTRPSDT